MHSSPLEIKVPSASQESVSLHEPAVHDRVQNSSPLVHILNQINPVDTLQCSFSNIPLKLHSVLPSGLRLQFYTHSTTCPANLILLDSIILVM